MDRTVYEKFSEVMMNEYLRKAIDANEEYEAAHDEEDMLLEFLEECIPPEQYETWNKYVESLADSREIEQCHCYQQGMKDALSLFLSLL